MVSNSFYRGKPKLTEEEKIAVVIDYFKTEGLTYMQLAEQNKCSYVSIHKWIKKFENHPEVIPFKPKEVVLDENS